MDFSASMYIVPPKKWMGLQARLLWQREDEVGEGRIALAGEVATMKLHDLTGKGEADACAFVLGGIEWLENLLCHGSGDDGAVVADDDACFSG